MDGKKNLRPRKGKGLHGDLHYEPRPAKDKHTYISGAYNNGSMTAPNSGIMGPQGTIGIAPTCNIADQVAKMPHGTDGVAPTCKIDDQVVKMPSTTTGLSCPKEVSVFNTSSTVVLEQTPLNLS
jgi:hypothetical protein